MTYATSTSFEAIMLSGTSQLQKDKSCLSPHRRAMRVRTTETDSRMVVARSWDEGEVDTGTVVSWYRVSVLQDEKSSADGEWQS